MNNYEYIIAGLPVLVRNADERTDAAALIGEIRAQLSEKDNALVDFLLAQSNGREPDAAYYMEAASSRSGFIRKYLDFERKLRNTKVEFLNRTLGREEGQDIVSLGEDVQDEDFPEKAEVEAVLSGSDILARERGLDNLLWNKIEDITVMETFSADAVLAFIAKLSIVDRWLKLDEESGRRMFRSLVAEIKENHKFENKEIQ